MTKINDTTTFPNTVAAGGDLMIGTDVSNTTNDASGETVNISMANLAGYVDTDFATKDYVYTIAQSGVQASHTGNTTETTMATIAVPAGCMGPNGFLRLRTCIGMTSSANNKTIVVEFGANDWMNATYTTTATAVKEMVIMNRNSASSQVCMGADATQEPRESTSVFQTFSQNTANAFNVVIKFQLANSGETLTLEHYILECGYGA